MKKNLSKKLPRPIRHLILFSQIRLFITNIVISLWTILAITAFFIGISLYDIFSYLPEWIHAIALLIYVSSIIFFIRKAYLNIKWPSKYLIIRELEKFANVNNRPLNNLTDKLSAITNSENQKKLWLKHLEHSRKQLSKLHLLLPEKTLKQRDPYRLGLIALTIFIIGFFIAGTERDARLKNAFTMPESIAVNITPHYNIAKLSITAWITPPAYTDKKEIYINNGSFSTVLDSTFTLHISNVKYIAPKVYINGKAQKLLLNEKGHYSFDTAIKENTEITLKYLFLTKSTWQINTSPDMPPQITLEPEVSINNYQELEWSYKATDDYGLASLELFITPNKSTAEELRNAPITKKEKKQFSLTIETNNENFPTLLQKTNVSDLTSSIFAGKTVNIQLVAEDTKQQIAQSNSITITLPKRKFEHPVAKKIIKIIDSLAWSNKYSQRTKAWADLATIAYKPEKYKHDKTVFLALVFSRMSLYRSITETEASIEKNNEAWLERMHHIRKTLWDTALHIEDGGFAIASKDLADALQNLADKIENDNLTEKELQDLMAELQETMSQYLQALSNELNDKMPNDPKEAKDDISDSLLDQITNKMDAGNMFSKWQELSKTGSKQDLKKMLEEMKRLINNLDPEAIRNAKPLDMKEFEHAKQLQKLIDLEKQLIEDTIKTQDTMTTSEQSAQKKLSKKQNKIKKDLNDIRKKIKKDKAEEPENLSKANKFMQSAESALNKGELPLSITKEKAALNSLQQEMDKETTRLAKLLEKVISVGGIASGNGQKGNGSADPLGRREGNDNPDTSDIGIPEKLKQQKIQKIMQELRSRSNDYNRQESEKDYIQRLLKRF